MTQDERRKASPIACAPITDSGRRAVPRHRLPGPQSPVHRQHRDLPRPRAMCRRPAGAGTAPGDRSPTCTSRTRRTRATRPTTAGSAADIFVKNPDGSDLRRQGVAGAERCSPTSAAPGAQVVGRAVRRFRQDGRQRLLERHERAVDLRCAPARRCRSTSCTASTSPASPRATRATPRCTTCTAC